MNRFISLIFYEHVFLSDDQLLVDLFLDVLSIKENHLRFLQYIIRRRITVENDKDFGNFNQRFLSRGEEIAPRIRIIFPMMQACVDEMNTSCSNDVTRKSGIKIQKDLETVENVDDSTINLTIVSPKPAPKSRKNI